MSKLQSNLRRVVAARPVMSSYFLGRPTILYVQRYQDPSATRRRRLQRAA